ncbi:hypothetical protein MBLNU459_g2260t1 [Dothideomycetes sp. NU459]
MTEDDFKKHFGAKFVVTDAKLFPQRRIGYIGYSTPEDAEKAVKYFHRTFIRMSKIGVELARPIGEAPTRKQLYGNSHSVQSRPHATFADAVTAVPSASDAQASLKRKRGSPEPVTKDPKLQEFLQAMQPPSKLRGHRGQEADVLDPTADVGDARVTVPEADSDSEYENVPKKVKGTTQSQTVPFPAKPSTHSHPTEDGTAAQANEDTELDEEPEDAPAQTTAISDDDWLRSRTSRLLGLAEDDEAGTPQVTGDQSDTDAPAPTVAQAISQEDTMTKDMDEHAQEASSSSVDEAEEKIRTSLRLYLRNLSYKVTEDDLRDTFAVFGNLEEVHVPMDPKTNAGKGFAYLHFTEADSAVQAFRDMDGKVFQGRLLHILPAAAKRETQLDDFALSKLPLKKQQQIKKKRDASSSTFNWNALYMNADAVMSSVADRLGVSKSELLDPTSSDAAVKQAHAETHVIQETKSYFKENGVDLDAFKKRERGDTVILVKNFPYDAKASELKDLFEEHGRVKRFLLPPTGTIAIIEFEQAPQARAAFASLAYRKIKSSVLFLEKAPKDLFSATAPETINGIDAVSQAGKDAKLSTGDLLEDNTKADTPGTTSTLFVRNLNFSTTSERLTETFRPLDGFLSARVKTKTDAKKPGQILSMGFGFLEFRSTEHAQAALLAMDGYSLDAHKLQIRASHKATDAAEERRNQDKAKKLAARGTKVIIKNLPFEATKKDIRALFGSYGQLRSVRVPKKFDKGARGFAFADFTTPKEAENAMDALRDTHLLGRRLVLDFAAEDPEDAEAEIEKMQKKAGSQLNKVALQKLTGAGRKKFHVGDDQDMSEA